MFLGAHILHLSESIKRVGSIFEGNPIDLPEASGVYAFWWLADKQELLAGNRHIVLKGPNERPVDVEYQDWWPEELHHPCLYVGKSTNIKKRFSLHIKRMKKGRLHNIPHTNEKQKPVTTSCQLRHGIEHVFKDDPNPLDIIFKKVGFSYSTEFPANAIAERFFTEDLLIGTWRPWFNVDSER
jgi:hypothetical protein